MAIPAIQNKICFKRMFKTKNGLGFNVREEIEKSGLDSIKRANSLACLGGLARDAAIASFSLSLRFAKEPENQLFPTDVRADGGKWL